MTDRELLETLINDIRAMKNDIVDMKHDIVDMKQNQDVMQADISSIKLTLENEIRPTTKMSLEHILDHSERLQTIEKSVQEIQDDLEINDVIDEIRRRNIKMN
ncbi:MAG: hypothetical protein IJ368_04940 [Oscillospiraceae bacterium]|nr:hypothetical protein [Oscillospiraceae bacterium]